MAEKHTKYTADDVRQVAQKWEEKENITFLERQILWYLHDHAEEVVEDIMHEGWPKIEVIPASVEDSYRYMLEMNELVRKLEEEEKAAKSGNGVFNEPPETDPMD